MNFITLIISALAIYVAAGLLFAIAFVSVGIHKVDRVTIGTSLGFRLLLIPGSALLWPKLLMKWIRL